MSLSQKFGFVGHVKIPREKVMATLSSEKYNVDISQSRNCFKTEWFKKYFKQNFKLENDMNLVIGSAMLNEHL